MKVLQRRRFPKTLKRIIITVIVLLILSIAGGVGYVYLTGKNIPKQEEPQTVANTEDSSPLPKPVKPGPNAPVGVAINALTTPVAIGTNASASIATTAGSKCTIVVTYANGISTDSGLAPKQADDYGSVTWTWTIGASVAPGTGTVKVTCAYNGRTGVVVGNQVITK
jgi:hypothetical protein